MITANKLYLPAWLARLCLRATIEKGVGHKYVRREPTGDPKKPWRYYYNLTSGRGHLDTSKIRDGAKFKIADGHVHITKLDGDHAEVVHDETGEAARMHVHDLADLIQSHHGEEIERVTKRQEAFVVKRRQRVAEKKARRAFNLPRSDRAVSNAIEEEIGHDFGSIDMDDQRVRDKIESIFPKSRANKIRHFRDLVIELVKQARKNNEVRTWADLRDARLGGRRAGTDTIFDVIREIGDEIDDEQLKRATIPADAQDEILRREEEQHYRDQYGDDEEGDAREPEDGDTSFDPEMFKSFRIPSWLAKALEHVVEKAAGHKYLRRVPTGNPKRPWRYYYRVTGGKHLAHDDEIVAGAAFRAKDGDKEGHFHVVGVDGDNVTVRHDETGREATMKREALRAMLHAEHIEKINAAVKWATETRDAAEKHGSEKQKARARKHAEGVVGAFVKPEPKPELAPEKPAAKERKPRAKAEAAPSTPKTAKELFEAHGLLDTRREINDGTITAENLKAEFSAILAKRDEIRAQLGKLTKDELVRIGGRMWSDTKKDALVDRAWHAVLDQFNIRTAFSWSPGSETYEQALTRVVNATTQAQIDEHSKKVAKQRGEIAKRIEGVKNPKNLAEFKDRISMLGGEHKLTPEERRRYDEFTALDERERAEAELKKKQSERAEFVRRAAETTVENANAKVIPGKHTKKGHDIFTVQLDARVSGDDFKALSNKAKALGGYYSSFRGNGAIPGFIFESNDAAQKFASGVGGGGGAATTEPEATAPEPEAKLHGNGPERLRKQAATLDGRAEEALGADRQVNTARRAGMAASAEARARSDKATARTMLAIADGNESGELRHLWGVKTRAHLDMLEEAVQQAKYARIRAEGRSSSDDAWKAKPTEADVDRARFPNPYVHKDNARELANEASKLRGGKQAAARILAHVNGMGDNEWRLEGDTPQMRADLETVADLASKAGKAKFAAAAIEDDLKKFRRATEDMGIKSLPQFRAMLREYLSVRSSPDGESKLARLKREIIGNKIPGYFPTPPGPTRRVMELADVQPGMTVLEPSAGSGNLADAAKKAGGEVEVGEVNESLRAILTEKGHKLVARDTLDHAGKYDRVVMNPPFENGQDIDHVRHAYDRQLAPGGRLVAIVSRGAVERSDKKATAFRAWLEENGAHVEELPDGSFAGSDSERKTGVATSLVVLNKPSKIEKSLDALEKGHQDMITVRIPAHLGALLWKAQLDAIEKGAGHKYLRRVPTGNPKKPYRYYYRVTGGKLLGHDDEMVVGAAFAVKHGDKAGHFHVKAIDGDKITIEHDESGHRETVTRDGLRAMLHAEHAEAIGTARTRAKAAADAAEKHGATEKMKSKTASAAEKLEAHFGEKKPKTGTVIDRHVPTDHFDPGTTAAKDTFGLTLGPNAQTFSTMEEALAVVKKLGFGVTVEHPVVKILPNGKRDHDYSLFAVRHPTRLGLFTKKGIEEHTPITLKEFKDVASHIKKQEAKGHRDHATSIEVAASDYLADHRAAGTSHENDTKAEPAKDAKLKAHFGEKKPAKAPGKQNAISSTTFRKLNAALAEATGWTFHEVTVNPETGFARISVQRADEKGRVRMVTLHRSTWAGKVTERREVGQWRNGAFMPYQDFSDSTMLGGNTYEGFPSAMRGIANYIDDNRSPRALGSSKDAFRMLASGVADAQAEAKSKDGEGTTIDVQAEPKSKLADEIPEEIRDALTRHLKTLQDTRTELDRYRKLGGRYEAEVAEKREDSVKRANEMIDEFLRLAKKNGVDGEAVIAELGGRPSTELSPEGAEWLRETKERKIKKALGAEENKTMNDTIEKSDMLYSGEKLSWWMRRYQGTPFLAEALKLERESMEAMAEVNATMDDGSATERAAATLKRAEVDSTYRKAKDQLAIRYVKWLESQAASTGSVAAEPDPTPGPPIALPMVKALEADQRPGFIPVPSGDEIARGILRERLGAAVGAELGRHALAVNRAARR